MKARKPLTETKLRKLEKILVNFIDEHSITCPEHVHQSDSVIEDAYELIEKLTGVAGYYKYPDE